MLESARSLSRRIRQRTTNGPGAAQTRRGRVGRRGLAEGTCSGDRAVQSTLRPDAPVTSQRQQTPSSSGNWVRAIIRTVDAAGFDGRRTALDAGVPGRVLRDATVRVPQEIMTRLGLAHIQPTER